mgnify:CR=1 FL=1
MASRRIGVSKRLYTKLLLCLFALTAAFSVTFVLLEVARPGVLVYLLAAFGCVALGSAAWEVVERSDRGPGGEPTLAAWLTFPVAALCALASLPLMVLSVYPEAELEFTSAGRVRAYLADSPTGRQLQLRFPRDTEQSGTNLRLSGKALPEDFPTLRPDSWRWSSPRELVIDLDETQRYLGLERVERVAINSLPRGRYFYYKNDHRVPQQIVHVEATVTRNRETSPR